jgi:hypothetical protein
MEWERGRSDANRPSYSHFSLALSKGAIFNGPERARECGEAANELTSPPRIARNGALSSARVREPVQRLGAGVAQW